MSNLFLLLSAAQLQTATQEQKRTSLVVLGWGLCVLCRFVDVFLIKKYKSDCVHHWWITLTIFRSFEQFSSPGRWCEPSSGFDWKWHLTVYRNISAGYCCPCWLPGLCLRGEGGARGRGTAWRGARSAPSSGSGGGAAATGTSARRSAQRRRTARPPTNTSARNTRSR